MGYRSTDIKNIIAEIIEDKKEKGGVKSLYFRLRRFSRSTLSCKNIHGDRKCRY